MYEFVIQQHGGDAGVLWRGRDHHAGDDGEQHSGGAHQGEFHFILTIFFKIFFSGQFELGPGQVFQIDVENSDDVTGQFLILFREKSVSVCFS